MNAKHYNIDAAINTAEAIFNYAKFKNYENDPERYDVDKNIFHYHDFRLNDEWMISLYLIEGDLCMSLIDTTEDFNVCDEFIPFSWDDDLNEIVDRVHILLIANDFEAE